MMRFILLLSVFLTAHAYSVHAPDASVYRHYWLPQFHKERLSFCNEDKSVCGHKIAHQYCRMLGYHHSSDMRPAPHIGLTNYISGKNQCIGWACSGFEWIKCAGRRHYQSIPASAYTQKLFVRPRWHKYPLSYCYQAKQGCGRLAAHAFCRWQAYREVAEFKASKQRPASKYIGNSALCFGQHCQSFEYIICKR